MLFDTHTHLNVAEFEGEIDEVIQRAKTLDVGKFAVVGFDTETIGVAMQLAESYDDVFAIIGWHPVEADLYSEETERYIIERLSHKKVVAMGEMGLDYYWNRSNRETQMKVFRRQIAIAKEFHLPVSIHNRDAIEDVYRILKEEKIDSVGGIMHSYSGDVEYMQRFLDLGMYISFSGVVTFKNAPLVRECARIVPSDRYLVETDAPYLTPVPYRGKRNEPGYTHFVAKELAKERGVSYETIMAETTQNAQRIFRLGNTK